MDAGYIEPQVNSVGLPENPRRFGEERPSRKPSRVGFEAYLKTFADRISQDQKKDHKLCEMAVTLHRRYRGLTLSDMCGRYGVRRETNGRWLEYDADLDGDIHPINVVQPAIRANTNACRQSNPTIEIRSANESAREKNIALRWQRVCDYFTRVDERETDATILFDAIQKEGTLLRKTYCTRSAENTSVEDFTATPVSLAVYQCDSCGANGMTQMPPMPNDGGGNAPAPAQTSIPCPQCSKNVPALIQSIEAFGSLEASVPLYDIHSEFLSFFNFTIDRHGAKYKGLLGAKWLEVHTLWERSELEAKYPHLDFSSPMRWSYPLQCEWALSSGDWRYLNYGQPNSNVSMEFDKFEVREIYLHEEAYANYVFREAYEWVNAKGDCVLRAKEGDTVADAYKAGCGHTPSGLKYIFIDERLIDIISPEDEEVDLRNCFSDVHWLRDSSGYLSSPNYSIVHLQDDITLLNTMNHNIIARNAVNPIYYNSLVFSESDFSKEYIGSKNSALLEGGIDGAVTQLPVPTPSPYLSAQLQFLWEIKDSVSQVQPALRGEMQKGETWGAQRQQLEQSYGMLTTCLSSYAENLCTTFVQKAEIAKQKWTLEQFNQAASMFGESWRDEDVDEMCAVDFEKDLIVTYRNGSEVPQSNLDREMKFFQGLQQIMNFPPDVLFNILGQDKVTKILQKIDEYSGFDFDLTGLEANEVLSQKRYNILAGLCEAVGDISFEQIEAWRGEVAAVDPNTGEPITRLDLILEQIFFESKIQFTEYEDLPQQKAALTEMLRVELGKSRPSYLLSELLQTVLGLLDQAIQQLQAEQVANSPEAQMQAAARAEADAKEQDAQQREAVETEQARQDAQSEAEKDRQLALAQSVISAQSKADPSAAGAGSGTAIMR